MEKRTVTHSTFVIERSYPAPPDRVFAALADPKKKRRWYAEADSREVQEFEMDFRVGGAERARFLLKPGTRFPGATLTSHSVYQDIVPGRRVVFAYTMTLADNRFSASLATMELLPKEGGTALIFTDQGAYFEGSDGPQLRQEGWQKLLERLGHAALED